MRDFRICCLWLTNSRGRGSAQNFFSQLIGLTLFQACLHQVLVIHQTSDLDRSHAGIRISTLLMILKMDSTLIIVGWFPQQYRLWTGQVMSHAGRRKVLALINHRLDIIVSPSWGKNVFATISCVSIIIWASIKRLISAICVTTNGVVGPLIWLTNLGRSTRAGTIVLVTCWWILIRGRGWSKCALTTLSAVWSPFWILSKKLK